MIFLFWNNVSGTHLRLSPNYFSALNVASQDMQNGCDLGSVRNLDRGGSRGRVQGVHTPPWDEAFFFVYTYLILIFFYLTVSDVIP